MKIVGFNKIHNFDISWPKSIFVGFSKFFSFFLNQVDIQEYAMASFFWPNILIMAFLYIILRKKKTIFLSWRVRFLLWFQAMNWNNILNEPHINRLRTSLWNFRTCLRFKPFSTPGAITNDSHKKAAFIVSLVDRE